MALTLQPAPRYCVDCRFFLVPKGKVEIYGRCVSPQAPVTGVNDAGVQYISPEAAEQARPYASSMRAEAHKCGPDAQWFGDRPATEFVAPGSAVDI